MRAWWSVILMLLAGATAAGQVRVILYGDDRLAGIHEVDVVVTVSADSTGRCPVARSAPQTSTTGNLRANRIRATISEKASSWHHTVQVTVQTRSAGTGCASAITTELVTPVEDAAVQAAAGAQAAALAERIRRANP